ncbi:MAG: hypothetical protein ACOYK8_06455 [Alphaproteobacteria bacterium]
MASYLFYIDPQFLQQPQQAAILEKNLSLALRSFVKLRLITASSPLNIEEITRDVASATSPLHVLFSLHGSSQTGEHCLYFGKRQEQSIPLRDAIGAISAGTIDPVHLGIVSCQIHANHLQQTLQELPHGSSLWALGREGKKVCCGEFDVAMNFLINQTQNIRKNDPRLTHVPAELFFYSLCFADDSMWQDNSPCFIKPNGHVYDVKEECCTALETGFTLSNAGREKLKTDLLKAYKDSLTSNVYNYLNNLISTRTHLSYTEEYIENLRASGFCNFRIHGKNYAPSVEYYRLLNRNPDFISVKEQTIQNIARESVEIIIKGSENSSFFSLLTEAKNRLIHHIDWPETSRKTLETTELIAQRHPESVSSFLIGGAEHFYIKTTQEAENIVVFNCDSLENQAMTKIYDFLNGSKKNKMLDMARFWTYIAEEFVKNDPNFLAHPRGISCADLCRPPPPLPLRGNALFHHNRPNL